MVTSPPSGVYVPVPTFFLPKSSPQYTSTSTPLDPATQSAHSLHLARNGITGLVVLGSTGEAVHLSNPERTSVLKNIRQTFESNGFPDYPLIAGTASQNVEEVLQQLGAAKDVGIQWGLVLVPGYFASASTQEGIVEWFRAVADESPIPIMVFVFLSLFSSYPIPTSPLQPQESLHHANPNLVVITTQASPTT
jgi:2-keto-3-deoxy-L-rhamnonate aldolase